MVHKQYASQKRWRDRNKERIAAKNLRLRARGRAIVVQAKDVPCMDCGGRFPSVCMDFDHVRGEKVGNVATMIGLSVAKIEAEIAKCEVVCSNCHRIRTH